MKLSELLKEIKKCNICKEHLPLGPNPVVRAHENARIIIIGQAPGTKVHKTGIPWNDPSGVQLRKWLNIDPSEFYNNELIAIVPMGFCYPGKGKSGDLPPRPECAEAWHKQLMDSMPKVELILLIGQYAQKYYLKNDFLKNLTETVKNYDSEESLYFPMPHPSPRNRFWLTNNPWFEESIVPLLKKRVRRILDQSNN